MKFSILTLALILTGTILVSSCSDTVSTSNPTVTFVCDFSSTSVSRTLGKDGAPQIAAGNTVDSLKVTRARILVSRLKLHLTEKDTVTGDKEIKTGPFMLLAQPGKSVQIAAGTTPAGTYDKVKFEFHRFSDSEIPTYASDTTYKDFVDGNRYTFLIDGTYYKNGTGTAFTYKSKATANLSLNFTTGLVINSNTTIGLVIDPAVVFKKGFTVLDPTDNSNSSDIDNNIKDGIKSLKK